jgi:hypothetical protein
VELAEPVPDIAGFAPPYPRHGQEAVRVADLPRRYRPAGGGPVYALVHLAGRLVRRCDRPNLDAYFRWAGIARHVPALPAKVAGASGSKAPVWDECRRASSTTVWRRSELPPVDREVANLPKAGLLGGEITNG